MARSTKILLALVLMIQLVGLLDHSLWTPDEPRVAEIAREMALSGEYLIPHLAHAPFLEQPPLYYATAALFYRVFGTSVEGVGRFASLLFSLATLAILFFSVRNLLNEPAAVLATLVLSTTYRFFEVSHKMLVDSALCCFITLAMFSLLLAWKSRFRHGYWVFWTSLALAFLTKGLVGLAIPAVGAGAFILWQRDFGLLRRMRAIPGILLLAVLLLAWAAILYLKGGAGFLQTFFVYNQFGRFFHSGGYTSGHVQPFYYYLLSLWWDAAPWSLLIIPTLIAPRGPGETRRFLHCWFLAGLVLLSLAATKRGIYLLPLFPALAAGIAFWMTDLAGRVPRKWEQGLLSGLLAVVALAALGLPFAYVIKLGGAWGTACILFALTAVGFGVIYRYGRQSLPRFVALCLAMFVLVWTSALFSQADRQKSYKDLFVRMGRIVADSPVGGYDLNESVEAFSAFYGGFHPRNMEKRSAFEEAIRERRYPYILLFSKRIDAGLRSLLQSKGELQVQEASDMRRGIELWKIGP